MKTLLSLLMISGLFINSSHAVNLVIKFDLSPTAQGIVEEIVKSGTLRTNDPQNLVIRANTFHVTLGFMGSIPDMPTAHKIGLEATKFLDTYFQTNPLIDYEVDQCAIKFGSHTVLEPTELTQAFLLQVNQALENHLNSLGYQLNSLTTNKNYQPHLSLMKGTTGPNRLQAMNGDINIKKSKRSDKRLFFKLGSWSYSAW